MNSLEHTETFEVMASELCRRVGLTYPPKSGKYAVSDASWTFAEESDFKEWLIKYLMTLPFYKRMGKAYAIREAGGFLFQYGWRVRE